MTIVPQGSQVYTIDEYTVDLRAYCWNGSCTCPTFRGYCQFVLKHQGESEKLQQCEHIIEVQLWVMANQFPALIDHVEKIVEMPLNNHVRAYIYNQDGPVL